MSSYTFEELIESVQRRPEIWQRSHPLYCNQARKISWVQISKELKTHEIRLRKSWKYLVDQFRKELNAKRKTPYTKEPIPSVWAYYNQMYFLKDEITKRQVRRKIRARTDSDTASNDSTQKSNITVTHESNIPVLHESNIPKSYESNIQITHESNIPMTHDPPIVTYKSIEEEDNEGSDFKMIKVISHENTTAKPRIKPLVRYSSKGASRAIEGQLENVVLENNAAQIANQSKAISEMHATSSHGITKADLILRKLQHLSTDLNDDDHMFFMSILPMVRTLSPVMKLQLRGKINEWLLQVLSGSNPLNSIEQHVEVNFGDNEQDQAFEDNKEGLLSQIIETKDDE